MHPINQYKNLVKHYLVKYSSFKEKSNTFSFVRLVLACATLFFLYKALATGSIPFVLAAILPLAGFVIVLIRHRSLLWEKRITENVLLINKQELAYLEERSLPFSDGLVFSDPNHFYTFDLDVFGKDSLFQHLNRANTFIGEKTLANKLKHILPSSEIVDTQEAVNELSQKLEWRQYIGTLGKTLKDNQNDYLKLLVWSRERQRQISVQVSVLSYLLPLIFIIVLGASILGILSLKWVVACFVVNLGLFGTQSAKIKREVVDAKNVAETIKNYGYILNSIETEDFTNPKLNRLQEILKTDGASKEIRRLSDIFLRIQGVNFDLGAIILNGTLAFHIHALKTLINWKTAHADKLEAWLCLMGEIEALNSLANFKFNNPRFSFPELNDSSIVSFQDLGHPLIEEKLRVTNSIDLNTSNFVILTGSNMSGKSTFLRTLGINMVLAGVGAPVCASSSSVYPMPIVVSMRQSDSLSSGESYFFAEVKRLKFIIEKLKTETCFVLLDEILRGTNSDDKQSGTIGVIQKIISLSVVGGIATHDLEVCKMTDQHPDKLQNRNFEVEIINDELVFDYKLREGICQNKSATFLMKKMEII